MKIKTSDLTGAALDWLVAKCEGYEVEGNYINIEWLPSFHEDWSEGGPIIERKNIDLKYCGYDNPPYWGAVMFSPGTYDRKGAIGPTPLIAAMRCYVASKFGDEVDVPEELI